MRDGERERWALYASAVLHVEVEAGTWVALNGPAAAAELPLGSQLFMVTAWDPFGEQRSAEQNASANAQMEAELRTKGAAVVRAIGRDGQSAYGEDGFAVSGLDRAEVLSVARRFRQEAIYEVDDTTIRIVSCDDGAVLEIPRHPVSPRP